MKNRLVDPDHDVEEVIKTIDDDGSGRFVSVNSLLGSHLVITNRG